MIAEMSQEYPVEQLCEVLECARSTYYYEGQEKAGDEQFLAEIEAIIMRWPFYGYRRVTNQLKRNGFKIGETRVRRLLGQLEHTCKVGKVSISTTDSQHDLPRYPNQIKKLKITRINQVWVADITYIRLGLSFIYLAVILDAYSRGIRGWYLSRSLEKSLTITALKKALKVHPAPEFHHSNGFPEGGEESPQRG